MAKIIAIRIRGRIGLIQSVIKTLDILKLRKKFSCVILDDKPETRGMLKKVQNYISYGLIKEETLKKLLLKRAKPKIEKEKVDKFVKEFIEGKKQLKDLGIKPFFSLHPPRGGFKKKTKKLFPEGILGKNEKINDFVVRML